MRALLFSALLLATPTFAADVPAQDMIDWSGEVATYTFGDWTVTAGDARIERPLTMLE